MRIPKRKVKLVTNGYLTIDDKSIFSPEEAHNAVLDRISDDASETVAVLYLNAAGKRIDYYESMSGMVDACVMPTKELWQIALMTNARAIIVAHNHPSGCLTPSEEDRNAAKSLQEAGKLLSIHLLDFMITGPYKDRISFQEKGLL